MSEPANGTEPAPQDRPPPGPVPALAAGVPVPGLSSWVLERRLGGGGFGEVWLARHAWNPKEPPRAVKFCTEPSARHRLVTHEKNVVLRVMKYAGDHPNVVPLLDCNLDGETPWLMYEFVDGGTLASSIERWSALPIPKRLGRAVLALHAIAGALATFHRLTPPIVHRDLKPQNVLMAGGKVPRITDFGIGGVAVPPRDAGAPTALTAYPAHLPTHLHAAGSANYAPTEQRLGSPPDPRDDVHALGVIAYQMLIGDLRFAPGPDVKGELRELKIPADLVALIASSVATNPERRPKDAGVWEAALAELLRRAIKQNDSATTSGGGSLPVLPPSGPPKQADQPPDEPPPPPPPGREPRRRPATDRGCAIVALGSSLLLGLAAALAYHFAVPSLP